MKRLLWPLFLFIFLFAPAKALAVCPVCTIAVGAGLGLSRWLGIDDSVSGVWVGGLIISSGLWLSAFLEKKNIKFPFRSLVSVFAFYVMVIPPLYVGKVIGHPFNKLLGIDKLVLGTIIGSVLFIAGTRVDAYLRSINNGKVHVYYQKVILPISFLIIGSLVFLFITRK